MKKTYGADFCNAMVFFGLSISIAAAVISSSSFTPFWFYGLMLLFISED